MRRGVRIARLIRVGSVNINEAYAAAWGSVDSATGGRKDSGLRPRRGTEGLLKYTETQTVAAQRLRPIGPRRGADVARYAPMDDAPAEGLETDTGAGVSRWPTAQKTLSA